MSFPDFITGQAGWEKVTTSSKRHPLGTKMVIRDRTFRYVEAAGTEINDGSSWLKIYGSKSAIFCAYADSDEPAGANHNMRVWLYNPASVTSFQTVAVLADYYNSNGSIAKAYITSGLKSDYDEAITGIKFYPSSGNFETGTVRMYGYNAT